MWKTVNAEFLTMFKQYTHHKCVVYLFLHVFFFCVFLWQGARMSSFLSNISWPKIVVCSISTSRQTKEKHTLQSVNYTDWLSVCVMNYCAKDSLYIYICNTNGMEWSSLGETFRKGTCRNCKPVRISVK